MGAIDTIPTPIHRGAKARPYPLAVLGRISEWLRGALLADSGFTGVLVANPDARRAVRTPSGNRTQAYSLDELRAFIPHGWRRPQVARTDVGRNWSLFRDLLRFAGVESRTDAEVEAHAHQLFRDHRHRPPTHFHHQRAG